MKKFIWVLIFSLSASFGIYAQTTTGELKQLKKEVNLPDSSPVFIDEGKDFPANQTLKIYLSIKHNKKFAQDFTKWVEKWNRENAAQTGTLQIIDNINDADIVAAQFRFGIRKYVREERLSVSTGRIPEDDKFIGQGIGNSKIKAEKGYTVLDQPLYSYLLIRNSDGTWTISFSYIDEAFDFQETFPEVRLQGVIEEKMKDR